ncbi:efflux RND transporter periplasmic adaptor subunit [Undibacterium sp. CY21W]|uniref:efflux RND transporter periplasmic adaptor subunit n=1 Tax=Undibacterium sp. CY21W TaxID=2762293 RepID=UPI00164ADEF2|nr:efflux RND transporter periplasmic adaptor subunit [Undibacterium sp. CY21W]MBC3929536.1 efflux RND transporter periplasmic adaptor subunit [Undibacterium sp. CY21W]
MTNTFVKQRLMIATLTAVSAITLAACNKSTPEVAAPPVIVAATTIQTANVVLHDELQGRVVAYRTAEIRPQVGGIVQKRLFQQGAEVRAGQQLFQIDAAPLKAEFDIAAAALRRSEAVLERATLQSKRLQQMAESDAVSRQVLDDAQSATAQAAADIAQAKATLARRRLDLDYASIKAPISGRIGQELLTEGGLVTASDVNPMAKIQQIDRVYVDVRKPASKLSSMSYLLAKDKSNEAKEIPVQVLDAEGHPYPVNGTLLFSGVNVDTSSGEIVIRIEVDNRDRQLLPGMYVRARVPQGTATASVLVPQQAVQRDSVGKAYLWVVEASKKVTQKPIELGALVGSNYVVNNGISAGQLIVVEGVERLQPGSEVNAQQWKATSASAARSK